jgi:hypothetical protein
MAQNAADPAANAERGISRAAISAGGALSKTADIDFGAILPGPGGGTFTVAPDGSTSQTGNLVAVGETHPAEFTVRRRLLLDFPNSYEPDMPETVTLTHTGDPAHTMQMNDLTSDFGRTILSITLPFLPPIAVPAWAGRLEYDFRVGGTLSVAADQAPGQYEGTFPVVVQFQ